MIRILISAALFSIACQSMAQSQVFGVDLPLLFQQGELITDTAPLPKGKELEDFEDAMRKYSKSDAPIRFYWSIEKMKKQPHCGRFIMLPVQGKLALGPFGLGGFICDDGAPPLQACPELPNKLVAPDATCQHGIKPRFTAEAQAMYDKALSNGGKTPEEVLRMIKNAPQK